MNGRRFLVLVSILATLCGCNAWGQPVPQEEQDPEIAQLKGQEIEPVWSKHAQGMEQAVDSVLVENVEAAYGSLGTIEYTFTLRATLKAGCKAKWDNEYVIFCAGNSQVIRSSRAGSVDLVAMGVDPGGMTILLIEEH